MDKMEENGREVPRKGDTRKRLTDDSVIYFLDLLVELHTSLPAGLLQGLLCDRRSVSTYMHTRAHTHVLQVDGRITVCGLSGP